MCRERLSRDGGQTRRDFIWGSLRLACAAGIVGVPAVGPAPAEEKSFGAVRPASPGRAPFLQRAFEMRRIAQQRGDQANGAVVVKDGNILLTRSQALPSVKSRRTADRTSLASRASSAGLALARGWGTRAKG